MKIISLNSEVFTRGVEDIVTKEGLTSILKSGKQLRVKHGIDATGRLHIGHAANLWKLRELQEAGHKAVVLVGDVTTQIGDPTGKEKTRAVLTAKEIQENIVHIKSGLKKILLQDLNVFELRKSSEWYEKMKATEFIEILSNVTHGRLIERDMFQQRIAKNREVFMHELVYPILQGYDSVMLRSDLTIVGSDQLFNEHMGRLLQERFGQNPQVIVACKILPGIGGGEKMSKSLGNCIGLEDSPRDKFGKAMRVLDDLVVPYLLAYTDVPEKEVEKIKNELDRGKNPMGAKLFLAESLVWRYHGAKVAKAERDFFLSVFSKKKIDEAPEFFLEKGSYTVFDLLLRLGFISSKAEARRLIRQGAVEIDRKIILNSQEKIVIKKGALVRVGKRRLVRII